MRCIQAPPDTSESFTIDDKGETRQPDFDIVFRKHQPWTAAYS
jgi:hypothetical protein